MQNNPCMEIGHVYEEDVSQIQYLPNNNQINVSRNMKIPNTKTLLEMCDIMEKKEEKYEMSFVGMMKGKNGIVAFGDSKGTFVVNGQSVPDDTPRVKVFKNEEFLLITYGINEFIHNGEKKRLEDGVGGAVKKAESAESCICLLYEMLSETFQKDSNAVYQFVFGYKNEGYEFMNCRIGWFGVEKSVLPKGILYVWGGMDNLAPKNPIINPDMSLESMKNYCMEIVNSIIRLGDAAQIYNVVGGPVKIETIK